MLVFLLRAKANEKQWTAALDTALVASIFGQTSCLCLLGNAIDLPASLKEKYEQLVELGCRLEIEPDKKQLTALLNQANQVFSY